MSFITPLIDTLLHEVLGRRMDPPPRRELTQPVKPALPDQAPLAIRSDSRLDARRPFLGKELGKGLPETVATGQAGAAATRSSRHASPDQPPPASSATVLSPTARLIAQLLARHPAPAAVLRPLLPLIPESSGGDRLASQLSGQLRSTISESGLFYESHLKQWYRGRHSLEALGREPQARFFSNPASPAAGLPMHPARDLPAIVPMEGRPPIAGDPAKTPAPVPGQAAANTAPGKAAAETLLPPAAAVESEAGARPEPTAPRSPLESSEGLQQLLRHQLELLASPTLRWEGEVWQGLFMALTIQGPSQPVDDRPAEEGGGEGEQHEWHSELVLDTASLGQLRLRLQLQGEALQIDLSADDTVVLGKLEAGREELLQGLARHGFAAPRISMRLISMSSPDSGESGDG